MPDAVAVTTIHGTKTMRRSDITSYSFYAGGKGPDGVRLISGKPVTRTNSWLARAYEELRIPLTFERDDEFDSWITSLPCEVGGMPLPARRIS